MKTSEQTRLLIAFVKEVFRSPEYKLVSDSGNMEALAETADFRIWLPQQTESHFAQPIEEAISNGIPADPLSLANYVLWFYSDNHFGDITFEEI